MLSPGPVRVCLLLLLVHSLGGVFVVEQPGSSLLPRHDRFLWLVNKWANLGIKVVWNSYSNFLFSKKRITVEKSIGRGVSFES